MLQTASDVASSPAAQFVFGLALFYGVQKFFKEIEEKLNDDAKLKIAVGLLSVKSSRRTENLASTFATLFDRVFGSKHISWTCFLRSCLASCAALCVSALVGLTLHGRIVLADYVVLGLAVDVTRVTWTTALLWSIPLNILPDYVSLLQTRTILSIMKRVRSPIGSAGFVLLDLYLTSVIASFATNTGFVIFVAAAYSSVGAVSPYLLEAGWLFDQSVFKPWRNLEFRQFNILWYYPTFLTSAWLWLYLTSLFVWRVARRFDKGVQWFAQHFDIERKPLQSVGLIAGTIVMVLYWAAAVLMSTLR